jgi:hypothetical protein
MPAPDQELDFRDLPAAALDSRSLLQTLLRHLVERASVAVKDGRLIAGSGHLQLVVAGHFF